MIALDSKQRFMFDQASILAWNASVQRARPYDSKILLKDRNVREFRARVLNFIETHLLPSYLAPCTEETHIVNIGRLVEFGNQAGSSLLSDTGYRFGIAQKLLNLLLKYLWCLGLIPEPPHCPVDRIILNRTSLRGTLNWTSIKSVNEYRQAIKAVRVVAKDKSLAVWELETYKPRSAFTHRR